MRKLPRYADETRRRSDLSTYEREKRTGLIAGPLFIAKNFGTWESEAMAHAVVDASGYGGTFVK